MDVYKTWTGVHGPLYGPPHGPGLWTTPWTTPNSQKEIAPVNMKIYWRSGYEKHILILIAYVLEGLSRNSAGCFESKALERMEARSGQNCNNKIAPQVSFFSHCCTFN